MNLFLAQAAAASDAPVDAEVDVDAVAQLAEGTEGVLRSFLQQLPQIALAIVVLLIFIVLGRLASRIVRRTLSATTDRSESFLNVMSRLSKSIVIAVGALIALIIAVPSVNLAAVIGGLGISSVAIGFAFKDILQNTLAGLLLLFRQPFAIGDQIEVSGWTGTVEAITIRETQLKTFDGQRILIPNSEVYSSSVRVQTAFEHIRSVLAVGVDYEADLEHAQKVALDAVSAVEGVVADPAPQALYTQMGTSTVDFDVRYWTSSRQADIRVVQDRVVRAVTNALNEAKIAMPADVIELDVRDSLAQALSRRNSAEG